MSKEDSRAVLESFSKPVKGSGMLYPVSLTRLSLLVLMGRRRRGEVNADS